MVIEGPLNVEVERKIKQLPPIWSANVLLKEGRRTDATFGH